MSKALNYRATTEPTKTEYRMIVFCDRIFTYPHMGLTQDLEPFLLAKFLCLMLHRHQLVG